MIEEFKKSLVSGAGNEVDKIVRELLVPENSSAYDINNWLFVYESIYPRVLREGEVDFTLMGAAVSVLDHLRKTYPNEQYSFAVQEMYLRVRAIESCGVNSSNQLLDLNVILEIFSNSVGRYSHKTVLEETKRVRRSLKDGRTSSIVVSLRELRNIKNLLGPIEYIKAKGVTLPKAYDEWVSLRNQLP